MRSSPEPTFSADASALPNCQPVMDIHDGHTLARAVVDTIREPLLVLDKNLEVAVANRSFYLMFGINCLMFKVVRFARWAMATEYP